MKRFAIVNAVRTRNAFTLIELLISLAVTALIILMVAQLMNSATAVTRTGNKHIDTDTQARTVLDRMALDFGRMLKRTDIDYDLKAPTGYKHPPNPHGNANSLHLKVGQQGNDSIAFFSQVAGYYLSAGESPGAQSPVSLVAYRVNSGTTTSPAYLTLERMGKGLLWNGINTTSANAPYPIVFAPGQIAPVGGGATTGPWAGPWYAAINNDNSGNSTDSDYETIGAGVFRLEYYYLLKDGTIKDIPKILCSSPTCVPPITWDFSQTLSANLNAFSDVEAIAVTIAVIDPASRSLLYDASNLADPYNRLFNLLSDMADFKDANGKGVGAQKVGDLENEWNAAVQHAAATGTTYDGSAFPAAAASAIRIYNRYFDLRTPAVF